MKFYVDCVGCEQRQLDAQRIINYLNENGHEQSSSPSAADYTVLVTCAVNRSAERASLKRVSELSGEASKPENLIISGCLPDISPDQLGAYGTFPVVSPKRLENFDVLLEPYVTVPMSDIAYPNSSIFDTRQDPIGLLNELSPRDEYDLAKNGYKIRVNNGCLMDCSYCVIKDAMGRVVSVPFDELVRQFEAAAVRKEPTIMFMGGDTGAYGYDLDSVVRFYTLLERTLGVQGDHRVFVHDFNANWYLRNADDYDAIFANNENRGRLRGVMIPVQSGSDKILKLMKRPYKAKDVSERLGRIKREYPSLHLGTHIITGFPSETQEDFDLTLNLLDRVGFDFMSVFVYSEHKRAKSSPLEEKIDPEIAKNRALHIADRFGELAKVFE
ncbi:MAG: radical SAM protein [Candidatus Aenigmatarchaeota archaeon]